MQLARDETVVDEEIFFDRQLCIATVEVPRAELEKGLGVLTAFAEKSALVPSNGEARRLIKAGGLRVNDAAVSDEKMVLGLSSLTPEGVIKLSLGKKKHVLLKPV